MLSIGIIIKKKLKKKTWFLKRITDNITERTTLKFPAILYVNAEV